MRFVIQRVNHAKCTIDGNITGSIEKGTVRFDRHSRDRH